MKVQIHFAALALLVLASCATSPSSPPPLSPPPAWTHQTVVTDGDTVTFVVQGSPDATVSDLALKAMTAYLALPVTPTPPPAAVDAIQEFLSSWSATPASDTFVRNGQAWWKIAVPKADWDKGRLRLQAMISTAFDPSVDAEVSADALLAQGKPTDAVTAYLAAALLAVGPGHTSFPDRFRALVAKAAAVVEKFTLASATPAQTTTVGQAFGAPFAVTLTYDHDPHHPLAGLPIRFSYRARTNGHLAVTGTTVTTDDHGVATLSLPTPSAGITDRVVAVLDVSAWLHTLADAPEGLADAVKDFEAVPGTTKAEIPYTVASAAKQVPLVVALADLDEKGGLLRHQETTSALLEALQKAGFPTSGVQVNLSLLKTPKDNVILTAWRFQGKQTGRAVYGTVALVSVTNDASGFKAEVQGTVKVADLVTSQPVYQKQWSTVAGAADRNTAAVNAFHQWAVEVAQAMESDLP